MDLRRVFASQKCQQSQGSGGVLVAERRTVVTFGLALGRRVSRVSTVSGSGGRGRGTQNFCCFWTCVSVNSHRDRRVSWLRNAELSSLLDSRWVVASQKCRQSQDRGGVVTFGLASGLRVSKVSTVTGIGGCFGCGTQNCRHFWTRVGSSRLKSVNSLRIGGSWSRNAELLLLWTCVGSSRLKSVDSLRIGGCPGCGTQKCRHFWTRVGSSRLKSVNSLRIGGSWSWNAELLLLLDLRRVFAPQSVNSHRDRRVSWLRNAELSSVLDPRGVFASPKCQQSQGWGGPLMIRNLFRCRDRVSKPYADSWDAQPHSGSWLLSGFH